MTPDQIISEIWRLKWHQVLKVAVYDDLIVICKLWPAYILSLIGFGFYLFLQYRKK